MPKPIKGTVAETPKETTAITSKGARYVIVMGPTGSGKTNFIWKSSGKGHDRIQHGLVSGPAEITPIECKHPSEDAGIPPVIFVDTPGFEDLHLFQFDGLQAIANWMNKNLKNKSDVLAGIIFLHRISDNRMSGSLLRQLEIFQQLCGMDVMKNVVVTTTMWGTGVPETTAHRRQAELQTTWLHGMIEKGCKLEEFRGTKDSAWKSIDYLLNQKPCPPLLVQTEMAGGKGFEHTSAAKTAKRGFWRKLFFWSK